MLSWALSWGATFAAAFVLCSLLCGLSTLANFARAWFKYASRISFFVATSSNLIPPCCADEPTKGETVLYADWVCLKIHEYRLSVLLSVCQGEGMLLLCTIFLACTLAVCVFPATAFFVSIYLNVLDPVFLQKISPNTLEESAVSDDVLAPVRLHCVSQRPHLNFFLACLIVIVLNFWTSSWLSICLSVKYFVRLHKVRKSRRLNRWMLLVLLTGTLPSAYR